MYIPHHTDVIELIALYNVDETYVDTVHVHPDQYL